MFVISSSYDGEKSMALLIGYAFFISALIVFYSTLPSGKMRIV